MAVVKERRRRGLALLLLVAAVLAAAAGYGWWQSRARSAAERQLGLDASRVLSEFFTGQAALKVGTLNGKVIARSEDRGAFGLLPSSQTFRAPYAVDYFVDMRRIGPAAYRWDAGTRTMTVEVPDVAPAAPNIDEARAVITQSGPFITRRAGLELARQASQRATLQAGETAKKNEHMKRARANARAVIGRLASAPLQAAQLGEVRVAVRFPWEPKPVASDGERWDESRPVEDVLRERSRTTPATTPSS